MSTLECISVVKAQTKTSFYTINGTLDGTRRQATQTVYRTILTYAVNIQFHGRRYCCHYGTRISYQRDFGIASGDLGIVDGIQLEPRASSATVPPPELVQHRRF